MSTCISSHGEYSSHEPGAEEFVCERCFVVDEDAMRAEIDRLRTALATGAPVLDREKVAKVLFAHPVSNGAGDRAPAIWAACLSAADAVLALNARADRIERGEA